MVNKRYKAVTLFIVINFFLAYVWAASSPSGFQIYCSAFCAPSGCTGFSGGQCNNRCNTARGWTAVSGACDVTNSAFAFLDCSDDAGGFITVTPNTQTTNCPNLTGYLGVAPYGDYKASDTVTVTLPGGTTIGHYALDFYFDLILIDIEGSEQWKSSKFTVTLLNYNGTTGANLPLTLKVSGKDGNSGGTNYKVYCGSTDKNEQYYQYQNTYIHNQTNTDISFTITSDNSKRNALWVVKEFIYVLRICSLPCLTCNNTGTLKVCFSCDISIGYMLNNFSCLTTCTTGFGYTSDPAVCIFCNLKCKTCYQVFDNCTVCQTSGTWKSYLFYNDTLGYQTCIQSCPPGYFANTTSNTCDLCDPVCATCMKNSTYCQSCITNYGWSNFYCYQPCQDGFYYSNNNTNCTRCNLTCITCLDQLTCYACTLNGTNMAYMLGVACYKVCPIGYFPDTNFGSGPNVCLACAGTCLTCTANPSPCQSCNNGSYLYNFTCGPTCPDGYFPFASLNQCLDCTYFCVDLTIDMYFPTTFCQYLHVDMIFTKPLDFTTFNWMGFQTVSIQDVNPSDYIVSYQQLTDYSYRLKIQPKGYIFLYNQTVTVTTIDQPATLNTANDTTPFKITNYAKTGRINWFILKSPSMTDTEVNIINQFGAISTIMATATTSPFLAEIKKSGLLAMFFSGAQITTCSIFINSIPPQNMYEGVRFWGIYVFYDVPEWQQSSKIPNHVFSPDTYDLVKDQRRLFDMTTIDWRFQRIGASSFFIYDVYIPLILIAVCWTLAIVAYYWRKSDKKAFKKLEPRFWTVTHKIHEVCILYVTLAMMLEWMYFDAASLQRWISFLICGVFTIYFVGFELYVYYDMIKYPQAFIGSEKYEYYLTRYGTYLKNLRYQEFNPNEQWSPKHWFRPYNYHILAYYKKFCMIISLPLFYGSEHIQPAVLIILQLLEIARFLAVRPYYARWRNIYRFLLQLLLLGFFIVCFMNTYVINYITANDPNNLQYYVRMFYNLGWAGFAFVFLFNGGFLILLFIDIARGFKYTNRELMEQARKGFYYNKIAEYQKENEEVPLNLMNKWVKMGNLNNRKSEELPDINIRVQYFKLIKYSQYFDIQILKIVELYINTDLNYHKQNNTTPGKKIKKKIKLSKQISNKLYSLMCDIFKTYAKKDTEAIIIKTFAHVSQRDFKAGDRIPLLPAAMFQKLELENHSGNKETIKLKQKLQGFPLNPYDLQSV